MSAKNLCTLCVKNQASSIALSLDKFMCAKELLQQLLTLFQIKAVVHQLTTISCEPCMADVITICDTLRRWGDAQSKLKNEDKSPPPVNRDSEIGKENADDIDDFENGDDVDVNNMENGDDTDVDKAESDVDDFKKELKLADAAEATAYIDYKALDAQLSSDIEDEDDEDEDQQHAVQDIAYGDKLTIAIAHDGVVLAKVFRDSSIHAKLLCYYCNKLFMGNISLQRHSRMEHRERYYVCHKCGTCFKSVDRLRNHEFLRQHGRKDMKTEKDTAEDANVEFRCQVCGRLLNSYFRLLRHETKVHRKLT